MVWIVFLAFIAMLCFIYVGAWFKEEDYFSAGAGTVIGVLLLFATGALSVVYGHGSPEVYKDGVLPAGRKYEVKAEVWEYVLLKDAKTGEVRFYTMEDPQNIAPFASFPRTFVVGENGKPIALPTPAVQ